MTTRYLERRITTALGITVGDLVHTSYNTGPYEVYYIFGPTWVDEGVGTLVFFPWPTISLACISKSKRRTACAVPQKLKCDDVSGWLNDIRREGDRYFTCQNDEIFVTKRQSAPVNLLEVIETAQPEVLPIPAQPTLPDDVDFNRPARWCESCKHFWNVEPEFAGAPHWCPSCTHPRVGYRVSVVPATGGESACVMALNAR